MAVRFSYWSDNEVVGWVTPLLVLAVTAFCAWKVCAGTGDARECCNRSRRLTGWNTKRAVLRGLGQPRHLDGPRSPDAVADCPEDAVGPDGEGKS